jgi:hypothetical protein
LYSYLDGKDGKVSKRFRRKRREKEGVSRKKGKKTEDGKTRRRRV